MYGKQLRGMQIGSFSIEIDLVDDCVIRFRRSDDKVVVVDLLVGMHMYANVGGAGTLILKMIQHKDDKLAGLESLEIDKTLSENGHPIILMHFPDVLTLFNRIGVRAVNDALMAQFEHVHGGVGGVRSAVQACEIDSVKKIKIHPRSNCHATRVEYIVRDAINTAFVGFIHNKVLYSGGSAHAKRIDHCIQIGHTILAIETDESAHQYYKKEDERYQDFMETFSYKFLFIRFNTHTNREHPYAKTDLQHKIRVLLHTIGTQMNRIRNGHNVYKLEIVKLFY